MLSKILRRCSLNLLHTEIHSFRWTDYLTIYSLVCPKNTQIKKHKPFYMELNYWVKCFYMVRPVTNIQLMIFNLRINGNYARMNAENVWKSVYKTTAKPNNKHETTASFKMERKKIEREKENHYKHVSKILCNKSIFFSSTSGVGVTFIYFCAVDFVQMWA